MSDLMIDFWPDEVLPAEKVYSPLFILRQVAGQLPKKSRNIYEAEVCSEVIEQADDSSRVTHFLNIVVPGLNRYARTLFHVVHDSEQVYPATLFSEGRPSVRCDSQDELLTAIHRHLSSSETRAILHSLAAKLNESPVNN